MFFVFLLFNWGLSFSAKVSLDAHVHYQTAGILNPMTADARFVTHDDTKEYYLKILSQPYLDRFFLLSEAYMASNLKDANNKNSEVYNLTQGETRAIPVCGLTTKYVFYKPALSHCLNLGFSGFKMHLSYEETFLENDTLNKIYDALTQVPKDKTVFLLNHYYYSTKDPIRNKKQTMNLLALSQEFPNVQFIIAHAALGNPQMLEDIANYYLQNPSILRNIYLETSSFISSFHRTDSDFINYYGYSLSYYRELFQKFGIERVLYGSDSFINNPIGSKEIDFILNSNFSFYEQDRILEKNGQDFLQLLSL